MAKTDRVRIEPEPKEPIEAAEPEPTEAEELLCWCQENDARIVFGRQLGERFCHVRAHGTVEYTAPTFAESVRLCRERVERIRNMPGSYLHSMKART